MIKITTTLILSLLAIIPSAVADIILFSDTFDRSDNAASIDATLDGITDNTGSGLAAGGVYARPFGPARSQVQGNQLSLATGAGTSNAYIDHNFTNAEILAGRGFRVSVEVTGMNQSSAGQGGALAIGMTRTDANATGDALNAPSKFQDGIFGSGNAGTSASIADFWVMLRGDGSLVWGGLGNSITETDESGLLGNVNVGSKTGTITAEFFFPDFNAGTTVNYMVLYNGGPVGLPGTFTWSENDANYIGLDARDNTGVTFDHLNVQTIAIPEPSTLVLLVAGLGVLMTCKRCRS